MDLKPSSHEARKIAVKSETHPITVAKFVNGGTVRPLTAKRITRALVDLGWVPVDTGTGWEPPELSTGS